MQNHRRTFLRHAALTTLFYLAPFAARAEERHPIRAAVGGNNTAREWKEVAAKFEADTGWKTQLVATGQKDAISEVFKRGELDVLTMHSGGQTNDLVAGGFGMNVGSRASSCRGRYCRPRI